MGLFQSKNRDGDDASPTGERADSAAKPAPDFAVRTTGTIPEPPTQGGNQVANIGKSISIKGDLTGNEDMVIEGKVEGKVDLPNNQLTIGSDGNVGAEITAKEIIVVGRVSGNIHGTERVEIQGSGVVDGDVSAPRLIVAEGAVLNGAIEMTRPATTSASETTTKPTPPPPEVLRAG